MACAPEETKRRRQVRTKPIESVESILAEGEMPKMFFEDQVQLIRKRERELERELRAKAKI